MGQRPGVVGGPVGAGWVTQLSGIPKLQVHEDLVIVAVTVQPPVVRINGLPSTTTTAVLATSTTTTRVPQRPRRLCPDTAFLLDYVHLDDDLDIDLHHNYDDAASALGSTSVLPPTGRISVELVVANAGNAQIANIWAAASVVPNSSTVASGGPTTSDPLDVSLESVVSLRGPRSW